MNPIDHPHGGRSYGGRPSCTPWGIYCKGQRTRLRNKWTNKYIITRAGRRGFVKWGGVGCHHSSW
jgi:large subunit ribosomal protein L2